HRRSSARPPKRAIAFGDSGRRLARAEHPVLETIKALVGNAEEQEIPAPAKTSYHCATGKRCHGITSISSTSPPMALFLAGAGVVALSRRNIADPKKVSRLRGHRYGRQGEEAQIFQPLGKRALSPSERRAPGNTSARRAAPVSSSLFVISPA